MLQAGWFTWTETAYANWQPLATASVAPASVTPKAVSVPVDCKASTQYITVTGSASACPAATQYLTVTVTEV